MNFWLISEEDEARKLMEQVREAIASGAAVRVSIVVVDHPDTGYISTPTLHPLSPKVDDIAYPVVVQPLYPGRRVQLHLGGSCMAYDASGRRLSPDEESRFDLAPPDEDVCLEVVETPNGELIVTSVLAMNNEPITDDLHARRAEAVALTVRGLKMSRRETCGTREELLRFLAPLKSAVIMEQGNGSRYVYDASRCGLIFPGRYAPCAAMTIGETARELMDQRLWRVFRAGGSVHVLPAPQDDHCQVHGTDVGVFAIHDIHPQRRVRIAERGGEDALVLCAFGDSPPQVYDCLFVGSSIQAEPAAERFEVAKEVAGGLGWPFLEAAEVHTAGEWNAIMRAGTEMVVVGNGTAFPHRWLVGNGTHHSEGRGNGHKIV